MAATHSRTTRLILNTRPLAAHTRSVQANSNVDLADVTTLDKNARCYTPGHATGTWSIGGLVDTDGAGLHADLAALKQSAAGVCSVAPAGYALGNQVWFSQVLESALGNTAPVAAAVEFTLGLQVTEAPLLGVSLHALAAETGADDETSVDGAAQSTAGGAGIVQLTAFTGDDITVKIQDSADNNDWADLVTFTELTAAGQEWSDVTGTVNRYLRATWSGTFTSATFAVAFARR